MEKPSGSCSHPRCSRYVSPLLLKSHSSFPLLDDFKFFRGPSLKRKKKNLIGFLLVGLCMYIKPSTILTSPLESWRGLWTQCLIKDVIESVMGTAGAEEQRPFWHGPDLPVLPKQNGDLLWEITLFLKDRIKTNQSYPRECFALRFYIFTTNTRPLRPPSAGILVLIDPPLVVPYGLNEELIWIVC